MPVPAGAVRMREDCAANVAPDAVHGPVASGMLCVAMSEAPKTTGDVPTTDATAAGKGPDPVIGAGLTLLGIFIMGVAGAAQAHYAFNLGTLVACVGAVVFVLFVALSALKQRKATANGG